MLFKCVQFLKMSLNERNVAFTKVAQNLLLLVGIKYTIRGVRMFILSALEDTQHVRSRIKTTRTSLSLYPRKLTAQCTLKSIACFPPIQRHIRADYQPEFTLAPYCL